MNTEEVIDWRELSAQKDERIRELHRDLAKVQHDLAACRYVLKGNDRTMHRESLLIAFLKAENELLKFDLEQSKDE